VVHEPQKVERSLTLDKTAGLSTICKQDLTWKPLGTIRSGHVKQLTCPSTAYGSARVSRIRVASHPHAWNGKEPLHQTVKGINQLETVTDLKHIILSHRLVLNLFGILSCQMQKEVIMDQRC
jgi:hypothetical protein